MKTTTVEAWVWILIYGGLLTGCLGWFVHRSDAALGWVLEIAGATAAAVGVLLIVVRSRMQP